MADTMMTAPFQYSELPHQIAVGIGKRIIEGIAHARLGSQMNNPFESFIGKQLGHACTIGKIQSDKSKTR